MAKWMGSQLFQGKREQLFLRGFRGLSYLLAVAQIITLSPFDEVLPETYVLLGLVGVYTVAKILVPFRWYQRDTLTYLVLGADVLVCASLPFFTGGLASGFLLYSFNPTLTAALLLQRRVALSAAAFSCLAIIAGQLISGSTNIPTAAIPTLPSGYLGTLIIYVIVCFLAALLPFIINSNAYHRIEEKATIEERNRLAREMHDNLAQGLGYLKLKTKLVKDSLIPEQSEKALAELNEMKFAIDNMYADLRESLGLLRVRTLDSIGLMATLADYVHEFSQRSGIRTEMFVADGQLKLSNLAELQVLRLVQEALTNIRKHAGANKVEVRFEANDAHQLEVSIQDNGQGFDTNAQQTAGGEHIGLKVMKERAESLGGSMEISSSGQGTRVSFRIPVSKGGG